MTHHPVPDTTSTKASPTPAGQGPLQPLARAIGSLRFSLRSIVMASLVLLPLVALLVWIEAHSFKRDLDQRQQSVKAQVESAMGVLTWAHQREVSGELSREQAQQLAKDAIAQMRYEGVEYFWINDLNHRIVLHPIKPELNGKDASGMKDPNGVMIFQAFVNQVKSAGSGFVAYQWPRQGSEQPVDKISFVQGFKPWSWVLGSGVYTDKVLEEAKGIWMQTALAIAAVLAVALLAFRAFYLATAQPLGLAVSAAESMGQGRFNAAFPQGNSRTEEGRLMAALDHMQSALRDRQQADQLRLTETEAQREAAANVTAEVSAAVDSATEGDFTQRLNVEGKEHFHAQLCQKFNELLETVSDTLNQVRSAASQLGSASEQVSQTSQSLSQGASQQAASVEETTASLQEMAALVKQNAESATVTDGIATQAANEAMEGGQAVSQTVDAMKSIATKISIVDDIAYQTNLLALNAAIEAARAGEHGKGFAVVAAEVRKLAERSQVAAQEIGSLARSSVQMAEQAGALLSKMVPGIHRTSELVQEIAAASGEQSQGVGQITSTMNHLNSTTQQTASASEQLSATAEELSAQAQQLLELVSFFKLNGEPAQQRPLALRADPVAAPAQRWAAAPKAARPSAPVGKAKPELADEAAFTRF
jgi:methyl-accepting chemotaxis protein